MKQTRAECVAVGGSRSEQYAALLSEQERSGLSVRAFALSRGLSPWTLYVWRRKLGRARRRGGAVSAGLVAVDVVERPPVCAERSNEFEVLLASGHRVRVPPHFDTERLSDLLSVLRTC